MKRSLWQITKEFEDLLEEILENEGEISSDEEELLAINRSDADEKLEDYYYSMQKLEALIGVYKTQQDYFKKKIRDVDVTLDSLKKRVLTSLAVIGEEKLTDGGRTGFSYTTKYRKFSAIPTSKVNITSMEIVPDEYKRYEVKNKLDSETAKAIKKLYPVVSMSVEVNLTSIKSAMKTEDIAGVEIEEGQYLKLT